MENLNHPDLQKYSATYPAGTEILAEGDEARDLYVLASGRLDVIKGGKKISEISDPGAFFGELSFLLGTVRIASVVAAEETKALCFPSAEVNTLWQQFPEFAGQLARTMAHHLYETTSVAHGFREFCDRMPDAVIMTDQNLRVLSWNQAAEKLYGRTWDQMRDQSIEDIYDNQAAFRQFMADLESLGEIREKDLKINHPAKAWCFVSTSTTILKDPKNNHQGYLFLGRDATSMQSLERKHRQIKNWLLPALMVLVLTAGILFWQRFSAPAPDFWATSPFQSSHLLNRLSKDKAVLKLALTSPLAENNQTAINEILKNYFTDFKPSLSGITGLIILDANRTVVNCYFPAAPGSSVLKGLRYDGSMFAANREKGLSIFLAERPVSTGGNGVEIALDLNLTAGDQSEQLVFRVNMELVREKYNTDVNKLAGAIAP